MCLSILTSLRSTNQKSFQVNETGNQKRMLKIKLTDGRKIVHGFESDAFSLPFSLTDDFGTFEKVLVLESLKSDAV